MTSDARGLFGPDSITWTIDRESALFLGGPRALLLQIAHPAVATAVEEHSSFRTDPLGRLQRTLQSVFTIVFGDKQAALAALNRVARRHAPVKGVIKESGASPWSGRAYRADDPELLLWVHATLVDTAMTVYEIVVRPLSRDERDRYYEESKIVARLFGIGDDVLPQTFAAFRTYFDDMIAGPVLQVGEIARAQSADLARFEPSASFVAIYGEAWGKRWGRQVDRPLVKKVIHRSAELLAAGMLPERLREAYGYRWGKRDRAAYNALITLARTARRALPPSLKYLPSYEWAVQRATMTS